MSGFQVMPPLSADERAELEQSIIDNGVQVPILVAADGAIVDGHHRDEIARKHNLHCPRTVSDKSEQELRGLAFSLNLHRRHLTREQKRQIVAESIKADPQLSDREHGRRTGVSGNTAAAVRRDLEATAQVEQSDVRVSGDGRVRPATQPPRSITIHRDDEGNETGRTVDDRDLTELSDDELYEAAEAEGEYGDPDFAFVGENVIECSGCQQDHDPAVITEMDTETLLCPPCLDKATGEAPEQPAPAEPTKPRRRALEEGFFDATMRLGKAVTSLQNLGNDDRLPRNKEKVARYRHDLLRAIDALQCVADQLNQ